MLGSVKSRRLDQPIAVSRDDLIPADNVYRLLETKVDLSFVREWSRMLYAERGRPSIDPVVCFKLQLVLFCEGIRANRQLVAAASFNEEGVVYRADAAICNASPVDGDGTASEYDRMVHRSFYADYLDRVRSYHTTEAYKKAIRKRQVWIESLFAEAKLSHGLRRLRLRGPENANIQGLLIAAGDNLMRLLARNRWGRQHASCGSFVALPREPRLVAAAGED